MSQLFCNEESIWNFKTLACTVRKIWHASDFILIFSKGHNSRKGDNSEKKKTCVNYFSMRNPYMKFQNSSMHGFWRADTRTDAQPETNMLPQLLWSWGHNEVTTWREHPCSSGYLMYINDNWAATWRYLVFTTDNWAATWQHQQNDLFTQGLRSAWASAQSDLSLLSTWRNLGSLNTHWAHSEDY